MLIFNEILVIPIFGFNRNTKKAIALRLAYQEYMERMQGVVSAEEGIEEVPGWNSKPGKQSLN